MINGRQKGFAYEREIADEIKQIFPDVKRHLEYQMQECAGFDLDNTKLHDWDFKVQCKRGRKYAPINKIFEVKEDGIPLLVTRGDRCESMVAMKLKDFIMILDAYKKLSEYWN